MKHILLLLLAAYFSSCASPLVKEDATATKVIKTNLSKSEAFNKAYSYLAKNLRDSNKGIKLKDKEAGKLIAQVAIDCNDLRAFADITSYVAYFTLELDFKDSKVRVISTADSYTHTNINGNIISVNAPMKSNHKDGAKACSERLINDIQQELNKKSSDW